MVSRDTITGLVFGIFLSFVFVSCVGATFPYKYYAYDVEHKTLVGANPEDDLSDELCLSKEGSLRPCIVVFTEVFFQMKSDYLKTKDALIRCQKELP